MGSGRIRSPAVKLFIIFKDIYMKNVHTKNWVITLSVSDLWDFVTKTLDLEHCATVSCMEARTIFSEEVGFYLNLS